MNDKAEGMSIAEINKVRKDELSPPIDKKEADKAYIEYTVKELDHILHLTSKINLSYANGGIENSLKEGGENNVNIVEFIEKEVSSYLRQSKQNKYRYRDSITNQEKNGNDLQPEELVKIVEEWREGGVDPSSSIKVDTLRYTAGLTTASVALAALVIVPTALVNSTDKENADKAQQPEKPNKTELVAKALKDSLGLDKSITKNKDGTVTIDPSQIPEKTLKSLAEKQQHTNHLDKAKLSKSPVANEQKLR